MPLDHPCEITRENGSKHDKKLPILSCPSASENLLQVFNKKGSRQQTLSRWGERIMWAKRSGQGKFLQNELLKNAISSSLSKNCVLRSINKCEIFTFQLFATH